MMHQRIVGFAAVILGVVLAAACGPVKKAPPPPEGPPWVENPPGLPPAIPDGPAPANSPTLTKTDFVTGLSAPWDIAFLPDGTMFFDERPGPVKVRLADGAIQHIVTPPDVLVADTFFGTLGLAVDPDFAANRFIYACYTTQTDVRVVRWAVNMTFNGVTSSTPIITGIPLRFAPALGCRVRFRPGTDELWVSTGDAHEGSVPQDLGSLGGKFLRATRDGAPYPGNPFGSLVYTYGHRNPQGIAFQPGTGQPYGIEHGTNRDDEVNRLVAGGNGGWDPQPPNYNENMPMTDLVRHPDAMLPAWRSGDAGSPPNTTAIAPSGADFLTGAQWKSWNGALAVATLKGTHLRVMFLDSNGSVSATTSVLGEFGTRLRVPVQGPDGNLYVATDVLNGGGAIWKITPS